MDLIITINYNTGLQKSGRILPEILLKEAVQHNFVYCAIRKRKWDSDWNFEFLLISFRCSTWIALLSAILIILLLKHFCSVKPVDLSISVNSVVLLLLQNGITQGSRQSHGLLTLWMLCSTVIVNVYTGDMTSNLIKPPPDDVITSWQELESNNFTLKLFEKFVLYVNTNTLKNLLENGMTQKKNHVAKRMQEESTLREDDFM